MRLCSVTRAVRKELGFVRLMESELLQANFILCTCCPNALSAKMFLANGQSIGWRSEAIERAEKLRASGLLSKSKHEDEKCLHR